eukprot:TRINITY_DN7036_c0_g1_i4.p1 TRINITY_DN7036_c0_g1~~TRINITY_DN7036_c0_g1_i4.p1  ORF type:complete len:633 (+),score=199.35 TRINITY_DN7036_c0_g1_i4:160-2058(+)
MEESKSAPVLSLPSLAISKVYSYLTFKELYSVLVSNSFFYSMAKQYFSALYKELNWNLLGPVCKRNHKAFFEIVRSKIVRVPATVSFNPLNENVLKSDIVHPAKCFDKKGIFSVKFSYDFSSAQGNFAPSSYCLTYGGTVLLYRSMKEEVGEWKYDSKIENMGFVQIECSKCMCGVTSKGQVFDIIPEAEGFSEPVENFGIKEEVVQVGCTVKYHYALGKSNAIYYWTPNDQELHTADCPKEPIAQISCEANYVYILYASKEVFVIDEQEDKVVHSKELSKLRLSRVASGIVHSIAMSQEIVPPLKEWSSEKLIAWSEKNGFEDYVNVMKYKKITGKDASEADVAYCQDVLGMVDENLMQKFIKERERYNKETIGKTLLYGWGVNNSGALASRANSCKYFNPTSIAAPELDDDHIEKLFCGFKTSALITAKGSLWIAGNVQALKKPEVKKVDSKKGKKDKRSKGKKAGESEPAPPEETKDKKAKGSKHKEALLEEKDKLEEYQHKLDIEKGLKHRWVNFDRALDPKMMIKAKSITMSLREIIVLFSVTKYNKYGKRVGIKPKGLDKLLKQIAWDDRLKGSTFIIGYGDRFLGTLEQTYADFVVSEVPLHRIQYIKKDGVIVWDRKTRLNKLI